MYRSAPLFAFLLLIFLAACSTAPEPKVEKEERFAPSMSASSALEAAAPYLPAESAFVLTGSGPELWTQLEEYILPISEAALEPGTPGTMAALRRDLSAIFEETLGIDPLQVHTTVLGANMEGGALITFGDFPVPNLATLETDVGIAYVLPIAEMLSLPYPGLSLYLTPIESPQRGLVWSLQPEPFQASLKDSSRGALLRSLIQEIPNATLAAALLIDEVAPMIPAANAAPVPLPQALLLGFGDAITLGLQGEASTLDFIEMTIDDSLQEARLELSQAYEKRHREELAEQFVAIYAHHLLEALASQAVAKRGDNFLRYDIELRENGLVGLFAMSGMISSLAIPALMEPDRHAPHHYSPEFHEPNEPHSILGFLAETSSQYFQGRQHSCDHYADEMSYGAPCYEPWHADKSGEKPLPLQEKTFPGGPGFRITFSSEVPREGETVSLDAELSSTHSADIDPELFLLFFGLTHQSEFEYRYTYETGPGTGGDSYFRITAEINLDPSTPEFTAYTVEGFVIDGEHVDYFWDVQNEGH